jgi:hypothetical protein
MQQKELYPKVYLYRRIVYAKLFIDNHFAEKIDLDNIADEAFFPNFILSVFSIQSIKKHCSNLSQTILLKKGLEVRVVD